MKLLIQTVAACLVMSLEFSEPNVDPKYDRIWCEQEAATDSELEYCDAMYPDLYPTEEEWEKQQIEKILEPSHED